MMLTSLRLRLRRLLDTARADRDLDEEMRFHVEMSERDYVAQGFAPAEARRRALLEFGGMDRFGEEYRDAGGTRVVENLAHDVRFAIRSLRRSPVFALCSIVTLAFGIGAATAMFGMVDAVLIRALPFRDADALVRIWQTDRNSGTTREGASVPDYFDYVERARTLSALAAHSEEQRNFVASDGTDGAERITVLAATHTLLPMLDAQLRLGRPFTESEDTPGAAPVALVSESFWHSRLGADPGVLGRTIHIDEVAHQVVGVVAAGAEYPHAGVDAWVPLAAGPSSSPRYTHNVQVVARLAPGASLAAARDDADRIMADLETEYPLSNTARGAFVEPLRDVLVGPARAPLLVLVLGVTLLLVASCANVANLLLARAAARDTEMAIRSALGAARGRLRAQLVTESLVLTLSAGVLAAVVATFALRGVVSSIGELVPLVTYARFDARAFAVALSICAAAGLLFGLVPARRLGRDMAATLRVDGARASLSGVSVRRVLVTAQIALSVLLLISATLLMRSFAGLMRVDTGFETGNVLKAEYQLPTTRYPRSFDNYPAWPEVQRFLGETRAAVAALPGVEAAALAAYHPLDVGFTNSFVIVGREREAATQPEIAVRPISHDYESVVGLTVLAGRAFDERDHSGAPAVILLNRAAVRRFFPGSEPLGQHIRFWGTDREVVGIVEDERFDGLMRDAPPAAYSPLAQTPLHGGVILVRSVADPAATANALRDAIRTIDPQVALYSVEPLTQTVGQAVARERFTAMLTGAFAAVTLLLTLVGVHGLVTYVFVQRSRELGIRSALGARPAELQRLFLKEGVVLAGAGIGCGILAAAFLTRTLEPLLYAVPPRDALTFAGVAAVVMLVAVAACWLPARRAGSISPLSVMQR